MSIQFSITLAFELQEPFERKTKLTDQQVIDKVLEYIEDERKELVQSAQIAAIKLLNGEVGMYQNTRFIHENNVLNDALAGGGGEACFFGDDVVVEIEIWQLELQRAIADSYGRSKAIRWTWFGGFEKTWDYPTENETRSLLVSSL